jgi:hypothetical protein
MVLKKATARLFYRLMKRVGRVMLPENTSDYRLLSRRAMIHSNSFESITAS